MLDHWNNMQIAQSLKRQHENIKTKTKNQALAVSFVAVAIPIRLQFAVPSWMNDDREKWTRDLLISKRAECIHKFQLIGWLSRLFGFLFHSINTFRQHFHFDHCFCVQQWCDAETNNTNSDICHTWYLHLLRLDVPQQIHLCAFIRILLQQWSSNDLFDCDRRHLFHGQSIKIRVQDFPFVWNAIAARLWCGFPFNHSFDYFFSRIARSPHWTDERKWLHREFIDFEYVVLVKRDRCRATNYKI